MRYLIYDFVDWVSYFLVEVAFFFDCWGPFDWVYSWGCNLGGFAVDLGEKWGILIENPKKDLIDEPLLIDKRTGR